MNNYFTTKNKYISNSRIGDFLKDKNYFYKKHITGEIENKKTPAMEIGSAVDCWLTQGKEIFKKNYKMVVRKNSKNPPTDYIELNETNYNNICNMCEKVEKQKAFQDLKDYKTQVILHKNISGLGQWNGICGIPDFFKIDGDNAIIVDLKTSATIEPINYHYHCKKFGYYRQLAMYSLLIEYCYGVKNIECRHFVVEKNTGNIFNCQTFTLDAERIELEKEEIMKTIKEIAEEKEFLPKNVSWAESIHIGEIEMIETLY